MSARYLSLWFESAAPAADDSRHISFHFLVEPVTLEISGWETTDWGAATLHNVLSYINVAAIDATEWGTAHATAPTQPQPLGFDAFSGIADNRISQFIQRTSPDALDTLTCGEYRISLLNQTLEFAGVGIASYVSGWHEASHTPRDVWPRVLPSLLFGSPSMGFERTREAQGFDALEFSDPWARDNKQRITQESIEFTRTGTAVVELVAQAIDAFIVRDEWRYTGTPGISNAVAFIGQYPDVGPDDGGVFGYYHNIRNLNKSLDAEAWHSLIAQAPTVALAAQAIQYPDQGTLSEFALNSFVAFSQRSVGVESIDAEGHSYYSTIRNVAKAVQGWTATVFSDAVRAIPARFYGVPSIGDTAALGNASWVSRSPRVIDQHRDGPDTATMGNVISGYFLQYVDPETVGASGWFGEALNVVEHFTIIAPLQFNASTELGVHRARKVTPEIAVASSTHTQHGGSAIRTQWRALTPAGSLLTQYSAQQKIEFKNKRIVVPTVSWIPEFSPQNIVELDTPDPPGPRSLTDVRIGNAISPYADLGLHATLIGTPSIRKNQIEADGWVSNEHGALSVHSNVLRPLMITPDAQQMGIPSVPNYTTVQLQSFDSDTEFGTIRLSPWWIWAPQGYLLGQDGGQPIDYAFTNPQIGGPIWGDNIIQLKTRILAHSHEPGYSGATQFSGPNAALKLQFARHASLTATKYGFPTLPGETLLEAEGSEFAQCGQPGIREVASNPHYLRPPGTIHSVVPELERAHLFRRYLEPTMEPTLYGDASIALELPPREMQSFDTDVVSEQAMIDYRIRERQCEGWDAEEMEYAETQFTLRVRIFHAQVLGRGPTPSGFSASELGAPVAGIRVRTLMASQIYAFQPGYPEIAA